MTTLAYCAVSTDGQGAPGEIIVRDEAVPGLRRFADVMHVHGAAASIQLGHAGPVAASTGGRGLAPSRVFTPQARASITNVRVKGVAAWCSFLRVALERPDELFQSTQRHTAHKGTLSGEID